jgi:hypothetical protein
MTAYVVYLATFAAFWVGFKHSPQQAFIRVYIPCLLFLPDYYRAFTPGLPDPNSSQAASVGLLAASLLKGFPGYKFSWMDLVAVGYAFCCGYSEFLASGYNDAQNLIFFMLFSIALPYFYAKSYIEPHGLRFVFGRKVLIILVAVSILSLYETRLGINLWHLILGRLFPGQGEGWVVTFRFGLARAAGPYGHALICGIIMAAGFRLARWLQWSEAWPAAWPGKLQFLAWLPMKPGAFVSLVLAGGLFISMAKGSWVAAIIGTLLIVVGRARNRTLAVSIVVAAIVFVIIPAAVLFINWASVGRANAQSDNQETAAYRYELVVEYMDIAAQRADWGWGLNKWPEVLGMPSIDNHYLLIFLMHGRWAFYLFLIVLIGTPIRLVAYALRAPPAPLRGGSLPFTLASIYLIYLINLGTVFMGMQSATLLFILTGWSEAIILFKKVDTLVDGGGAAPETGNQRKGGFRRVL